VCWEHTNQVEGQQHACHAFQASTKTKTESRRANHVQRIPLTMILNDNHNVMHAHLVEKVQEAPLPAVTVLQVKLRIQ
jgi:hypothetical protein